MSEQNKQPSPTTQSIINAKLEPKKTKNRGRVDPKRRANLTPNIAGNYRGKKAADELLTEKERKQHHIASEQKRRRNIKLGYERLCNLVPRLIESKKSGGASEVMILEESVSYIDELLKRQAELREMLGETGIDPATKSMMEK